MTITKREAIVDLLVFVKGKTIKNLSVQMRNFKKLKKQLMNRILILKHYIEVTLSMLKRKMQHPFLTEKINSKIKLK
jgi:hypothetical protein